MQPFSLPGRYLCRSPASIVPNVTRYSLLQWRPPLWRLISQWRYEVPVRTENAIQFESERIAKIATMIALPWPVLAILIRHSNRNIGNAALRHRLMVLRCQHAAGSGLRISIGCFQSSYTAGFDQSYRSLPASSRKQLFTSIGPAFADPKPVFSMPLRSLKNCLGMNKETSIDRFVSCLSWKH